jgi:ketosteroid isomerase-like protein
VRDPRSAARDAVQEFASAWLDGDYEAIDRVCSPSVRWWVPWGTGTAEGAMAIRRELERLLTAAPGPLAISGLLVSEDGSRGVVEMRADSASRDAAPTLLTSVVTLSSGRVIEGRTYTDLLPQGDPR